MTTRIAARLLAAGFALGVAGGAARAFAQAPPAPPALSSSTAQVLTLNDALKLARENSPEIQAALAATGTAHTAAVQARSGILPNLSLTGGYTYTQPNSTGSGVFVANNGPDEYIAQANVHEALSLAGTAGYRSAAAAEDLAKAQQEIVSRGLLVTVVLRYDALVVAQRKQATAQLASRDAQQFLTMSEDRERGGEAAHADVIKAQIQLQQRQRELREADLGFRTSQNELAIVLFPTYRTDFSVTDDLEAPAPLPALDVVQRQAARHNPAIAAATAALRQAHQDVWVARGEMLPSLAVDYFYGLDANQFSTMVDGLNLLGSSVVASVSVPIWNWGASESQLATAHLRERQARTDLSFAQRQLLADLHSLYDEAQAARAELDSLKQSADLAAESLRLTTLRYQAGEATALEVVDAQTTLIDSRNAYDDGQARYHLALANLQTLTGSF
ncbi:MAG TPA: TolC family protein [Vicinamibacterales bacterium]